MTSAIDTIINNTIGKEGKWVNNPKDPGGETIWGITKNTALRNGYTGPMKNMPRETAFNIYKAEYFIKPGFDKVAAISEKVAEELFDTGVNMGQGYPGKWFQEWLNAFNREGKDYPDIQEDGNIGSKTLAAFLALIRVRGKDLAESIILKGLNADQAVRYKALTRNRSSNEEFAVGWVANRVGFE